MLWPYDLSELHIGNLHSSHELKNKFCIINGLCLKISSSNQCSPRVQQQKIKISHHELQIRVSNKFQNRRLLEKAHGASIRQNILWNSFSNSSWYRWSFLVNRFNIVKFELSSQSNFCSQILRSLEADNSFESATFKFRVQASAEMAKDVSYAVHIGIALGGAQNFENFALNEWIDANEFRSTSGKTLSYRDELLQTRYLHFWATASTISTFDYSRFNILIHSWQSLVLTIFNPSQVLLKTSSIQTSPTSRSKSEMKSGRHISTSCQVIKYAAPNC